MSRGRYNSKQGFFSNLFAAKPNQARRKGRRGLVSTLEALEDRIVMDASVAHTGYQPASENVNDKGIIEDFGTAEYYNKGTLNIVGDNGHADQVRVNQYQSLGGEMLVRVRLINYSGPEMVNHTKTTIHDFPASSITRINFSGGAGNDYFVNDTAIPTFVNGDAGNDTIFSGFGRNEIHGGSGIDKISLRSGSTATPAKGSKFVNAVYGDGGTDHIYGSQWADLLIGGEGDDYIEGGGLDDTLDGGGGSDTLHGNGGSDTLHGNGGSDTMFGGAGEDWMWGGTGEDKLDGGYDNIADHLFGDEGFDTFSIHKNATGQQSEVIQDSDEIYVNKFVEHVDTSGLVGDHKVPKGKGSAAAKSGFQDYITPLAADKVLAGWDLDAKVAKEKGAKANNSKGQLTQATVVDTTPIATPAGGYMPSATVTNHTTPITAPTVYTSPPTYQAPTNIPTVYTSSPTYQATTNSSSRWGF